MDTLFRGDGHSINSANEFPQLDFDQQHLLSQGNLVNGCQFDHLFNNVTGLSKLSSHLDINSTPCEVGDDSPVEGDYFDGVFKYLQRMLMEEDDLLDKPCMLQDCLALQAAEKSFYEVLNENQPSTLSRSPSPTTTFGGQTFDSPIDDFAEIWPNHVIDHVVPHQTIQYNFQPTCIPGDSLDLSVDYLVDTCLSPSQTIQSSTNINTHVMPQLGEDVEECRIVKFYQNKMPSILAAAGEQSSHHQSRKKSANHDREGGDHDEDRPTKHFASHTDEIANTDDYDNALLCPARNPNFYGESPSRGGIESPDLEGTKKQQYVPPTTAKRGRPRAGQKRDSIRELVDLRDLLTRCAHAVAIYDNWTANELLKQIRQHSSPYGDPTERLAYCFANALEARLAGMGTTLYSALTTTRASAADILRAYGAYLEICPFQRMSNIFANKSIAKQTSTVTRIHIIDFGILYGFQWPCLIHGISLRPGGPPKLRITGVDLPQPGFRPAERIEETGGRLANYAKRFNVPFEFNAVAKRWDTITAEDLAIDEDEMVVVNCLYRLRNVPDETVIQSSPRDSVMNLIKKINPEMFVHGVLNGTYGAPFFVTRFKEALYHFSSLFDMFEATLPREDQNRSMFEKEVIGREVMNVIACEGTERIERPDSYKQWQVRNQRAGFKQLPLNSEIMREVRAKVKSYYNKDFLIDADGAWMLQGWKGRVIYALSCWKPAGL
ncbi:scarecrow-like protein 30 [Coffea arabica]|uniref:Scarecrow-like protein 30 n=1 Tax=Coffea arabica TaxID=13443 RepID=A0A6P6TFD5_COFAR|nr:scarecrow-like protein 14 [Coffea arabica]